MRVGIYTIKQVYTTIRKTNQKERLKNMNKEEEIRWPLNKGTQQIQRNVNQMKHEMPLSSIRQKNLETAHLLGAECE